MVELVAEAKENMSKDAVAIRMRNQSLIDHQHRLREEARIQCEKALEDANRRVKEASEAYGVALELQLKSLEESTITEETLLDEMLHASQSHRDRIRAATAIPPLALDADMLQWQTRCAAAEGEAEDLQRQLQELLRPDAEDLERKVERLQKELEDLQRSSLQKQRILETRQKALVNANAEKLALQRELDGANKALNQINRLNSTLTHQNKMDENVMCGMKTRMETAENELERLKRKRAGSTSPERTITGILKRQAASPPTGQDVPSSSAQPTPKKSRNRKDRWDAAQPASLPPKMPPTSSNRDGFKRRK